MVETLMPYPVLHATLLAAGCLPGWPLGHAAVAAAQEDRAVMLTACPGCEAYRIEFIPYVTIAGHYEAAVARCTACDMAYEF